jgi:protein-S-isoprenylcysteine O-methyltransferase Ste14
MNVHATPVGYPAWIIFWVGLLVFAVLVALKREGGKGEAGAKRSGRSVLGILIQCLAFVAVGLGQPRFLLAAASREAVEQGAATLIMVMFTCWLFWASKRALGRNWSVVARTRADHELVTAGPFAYVRHPIYSALFVWLIAMAVAFGHYWGLVLATPLYWIGTVLRIREEERLLRACFGADYETYARRVKRFVPGVI